jgi:23S rRNA (guanosine2251-2'-O)-methyltransferase
VARPAATPDDSSVLAGRRPVLELLRAERSAERILLSEQMAASKTISEIRKRATAMGIPVRTVPKNQIDKLAGGLNHQGVVAITGRFRYAPLEDLLQAAQPLLLFLDGVTDPHNLGSLLRSADGAGFTGIVLPARRSVAVTAAVRRVSAGASEVVPVARVGNLGRAVDEAREAGVWILGLDEDAPEDIWGSDLLEPPVGLVLGAEDRGISPTIRERCDAVVSIPSAGRLASLNVAVAGAVVMFEIARRRGQSVTL